MRFCFSRSLLRHCGRAGSNQSKTTNLLLTVFAFPTPAGRTRFFGFLPQAARLEQGVSIGEAARALEVNPNVLHRWRREFRTGPGNAFPGHGKQRWAEGRIAELERKVGQQALEIDFLKGCLQRIEEQRMLQAVTGNPRSTGRSKKK